MRFYSTLDNDIIHSYIGRSVQMRQVVVVDTIDVMDPISQVGV